MVQKSGWSFGKDPFGPADKSAVHVTAHVRHYAKGGPVRGHRAQKHYDRFEGRGSDIEDAADGMKAGGKVAVAKKADGGKIKLKGGGKARSKRHSGSSAKQAAGALTKIAQVAAASQPPDGGPGPVPAGLMPGAGGPPGMPPGAPPGMRTGGKAKKR